MRRRRWLKETPWTLRFPATEGESSYCTYWLVRTCVRHAVLMHSSLCVGIDGILIWSRTGTISVWYGEGDTSTPISTALRWPILTAIGSDRIGLDWIGSDRIGLDYCATSIDTVPGKSPHIMGILNHHDSKNAFDPRSWTWEPRPWFLDPVLVEQ
jgi:hypothetical protein